MFYTINAVVNNMRATTADRSLEEGIKYSDKRLLIQAIRNQTKKPLKYDLIRAILINLCSIIPIGKIKKDVNLP